MSGLSLAVAMLIANPVILGAKPPAASPAPSGAAEMIADSAPADMVQGKADRHDRMTIDVAVHGTGPYSFLIDTGSQRTVVSTALAGTLGLASGPRVRVMGMAGLQEVGTAQVDSIDVGARSFYDLNVPLLDRDNIGADGILGTDSLQNQRVLLDFAHETIRIGDPRELGGKRDFEIVVHARQRSGRLILTNATIDGVRTDVVIDTGASSTVGNRALQRALAARGKSRAVVVSTLDSVTGANLPVDLVLADKLELAGMTMRNVVVAYADAPAFRELKLDRRPAVFLGMREMRAFSRIAIDFPTRQVLFDLIGAK